MISRLLQTIYNLPERKLELIVEITIQGKIQRNILEFSQSDLFIKADALGKTEWDFETIAVLIYEQVGSMPVNMEDLLLPAPEVPTEPTPENP